MPGYTLSALARKDLVGIARFTQSTWGEIQAQKYVRELLRTCTLLGEHPRMGRQVPALNRRGSMRFEHASHVIFYRQVPEGIVVQRILHMHMLGPGEQASS